MQQDVNLPLPFPQKAPHEGRYARLEPLALAHVADLWNVAQDGDLSWRHLRYGPCADIAALQSLVQELAGRAHQPFWAVIDKADGSAKGWLSLCDVYPMEAAIEIGSIWFSPAMQRTRVSTEAVSLLMTYVFDVLGYQRLVWRCFADNLLSRRAAERYGFVFEGHWRAGAIAKGVTRDVRWHAMLRSEWPAHSATLTAWLAPDNFDADGRAVRRLAEIA
jgi:RimJ/RimL family protein N-acetyltransferase